MTKYIYIPSLIRSHLLLPHLLLIVQDIHCAVLKAISHTHIHLHQPLGLTTNAFSPSHFPIISLPPTSQIVVTLQKFSVFFKQSQHFSTCTTRRSLLQVTATRTSFFYILFSILFVLFHSCGFIFSLLPLFLCPVCFFYD